MRDVDNINLKVLDFHDPGLSIYHIPEYTRYENDQRYKLIFVIDAGEKIISDQLNAVLHYVLL